MLYTMHDTLYTIYTIIPYALDTTLYKFKRDTMRWTQYSTHYTLDTIR